MLLAASFASESRLVQETEHPEGDVMERGVLDVVPYNVGFRGDHRSNLSAGFVFPTYLKSISVSLKGFP